MEINELRFNNWVDYGHKPRQISGLHDEATVSVDGIVTELKVLSPIIITDEWMMDFGFKKDKSIHFKHDVWIISKRPNDWDFYQFRISDLPKTNPNCGIFSLHYKEAEGSGCPPDLIRKQKWTKEDEKRASEYTVKIPASETPFSWHIKYIHELQNIYYSVTGKELVFKNNIHK